MNRRQQKKLQRAEGEARAELERKFRTENRERKGQRAEVQLQRYERQEIRKISRAEGWQSARLMRQIPSPRGPETR